VFGGNLCPFRIPPTYFDFSVRGLYMVYEMPTDGGEGDYWTVGEYAIVFSFEDGRSPHTDTLHVTDAEIIRLDFRMYWPPSDQILERSGNVILPPSTHSEPYP
jgi:hypothetical protein